MLFAKIVGERGEGGGERGGEETRLRDIRGEREETAQS